MATHVSAHFVAFVVLCFMTVDASRVPPVLADKDYIKLPTESRGAAEASIGEGIKWAILIAGSAGYGNYRHQADACHAYQLLKKNGLKDENIVTFMYDDIATNPENPHPGTIINRPFGSDVYSGVPKDYTGHNVTVANFLAVLKGDQSGVTGGSGKVVASGPQDHVFVFYSDHGGPGVLGMPTLPYLYADDVVDALKAKYAAGGYKELVFYLEACESGSIFEGLLPDDIAVYATTASNAMESSWGTYCPGMEPEAPPEFETCLGDLYSVAWMEDSDIHNLNKETLETQYQIVKERTSNHATYEAGSHVMQYGSIALTREPVGDVIGTDPANENAPDAVVPPSGAPYEQLQLLLQQPGGADLTAGLALFLRGGKAGGVEQRDVELVHLFHKYKNAGEGSERKAQALEEINAMAAQRTHIDRSVALIGKLLLGAGGPTMLTAARPAGRPLVDDWACLKAMVRTYETECGHLTQYGMKHMRSFANLCNRGISLQAVGHVAREACAGTNRFVGATDSFSA